MDENKKKNLIMLFSGLAILLGDIVLFVGFVLGGLRIFNIPFSIGNWVNHFTDFTFSIERLNGNIGNSGFYVVSIALVGIAIGLIVDLIGSIIRFFKLVKLKADADTANKNFSAFLYTAGAIYGICGGGSLCSVAMNAELSYWGIAMICLSFLYIVLMTVLRFLLNNSDEEIKSLVMSAIGVVIMCAVVIVVSLFYTKSIMISTSEATYGFIFFVGEDSISGIVDNILIWVRFCIAIAAGAMLSSTVFSVSPIFKKNGKKKFERGGFIYGIVMAFIAVGAKIAEMCVFENRIETVTSEIVKMIPLFLCSVVGLIAIDGLIKRKRIK